jgi:hypothetical protein
MPTIQDARDAIAAINPDATLFVDRHARNPVTGAIGEITLYSATSIGDRLAIISWPIFDGDTITTAALQSLELHAR